MTPTQYIRLRKQLGLSNYALAPILGVSLRQAQRYESGQTTIPDPVARLLTMYGKHGIPTPKRNMTAEAMRDTHIPKWPVTSETKDDTNKPDECPHEPSNTDPAQ